MCSYSTKATWRALAREAGLAPEHMAIRATAIGRARPDRLTRAGAPREFLARLGPAASLEFGRSCVGERLRHQ
jgi:hypothetical protein